jgi:hypothetical protein
MEPLGIKANHVKAESASESQDSWGKRTTRSNPAPARSSPSTEGVDETAVDLDTIVPCLAPTLPVRGRVWSMILMRQSSVQGGTQEEG